MKLQKVRTPDKHEFLEAMDRQAMDLIVEKIETEEMLLELLDLKIDFGRATYLENQKQ